MNPRYLATYKHYNGQTTELLTVSVGRFYNPEEAKVHARELLDKPGNEITQIRQETSFEATKHKVVRFCIRSLRIIASAAIAIAAYLFLYEPDSSIGDVPFSSLTLNMILSGLFRTGLLIGAAFVCWYIAFGKGPKE